MCGISAFGGMAPNLPALKSSIASMISALVFITNGPYWNDRLADRLAAEQQHLERGRLRVLARVGRDGDAVAGAEHRELALLDRAR